MSNVTYGEKVDKFLDVAKIGAYKMLQNSHRHYLLRMMNDDEVPEIFYVTNLSTNQNVMRCQLQAIGKGFENLIIKATYVEDEDRVTYEVFEWISSGELVDNGTGLEISEYTDWR